MIRLFVVAGLVLSLQGCFFIYIPGSVFDSLSGDGSHCVGDSAKVGDKIRLASGVIGTVEKLSGYSSRCIDPKWPVRAKLALES